MKQKKRKELSVSQKIYRKRKRKPRCRLRDCKKEIAGQNNYICERNYKDVIKTKKRRKNQKRLI